jgi:hypothetical protein
MVLVAFLGSRLGSQSRKLLRHKQMRRGVGDGQNRERAGTTPPLTAARNSALVVPALWLPETRAQQDHKQISSGSRADQVWIQLGSTQEPSRKRP